MKEALARLDALMNRLVEADQTGAGIEPLRVANAASQDVPGHPETAPPGANRAELLAAALARRLPIVAG